MNRIDQIAAEIAELESQIAALKAEREELENAEPVVTYTVTDKKRVFVNGELVEEQGGKSVKARAKVIAFNDVWGDLGGGIAYRVIFSNVDPIKLMNTRAVSGIESEKIWEQVVELS